MAEENKTSTSWWVHIDVTAIVVVGALLLAGYMAKSFFTNLRDQEVTGAEKAKLERIEKEDRDAARREDEYKRRKEEYNANEAKTRELYEKSIADRVERERKENEALRIADDKRRAMIAEVELKRAELYVGEQKRQAEREALDREQALLVEKERNAQSEREGKENRARIDRFEKERSDKLERARLQEIENQKGIIVAADKEVADCTNRIEILGPKMIAYKNRMQYALKQSDALRESVRGLQSAQGSRKATGSTASVSLDLSDEIIKGAAKHESVSKEFREMAEGYANSIAEKERTEKAIGDAGLRRDQAVKALVAFGVNAKPAAPAPPAPRPAAANAIPWKIYVMKDGRRLTVQKAIEAGDTVSVKTEAGTFESLSKANIEKIEDAP